MSAREGRRKLHAIRTGFGQSTAQHVALPEFTWASDRSPQPGSTPQLTPITPSLSVQSAASTVYSGDHAASHGDAEAIGFRWISDYISDDEAQDACAQKRSQSLQSQQPQAGTAACSRQQHQEQRQQHHHHPRAKHTLLPAVQLVADAASGANTAASAAGAAASLAATAVAGAAGAAARTAVAVASTWFATRAVGWLDGLLGYDDQLASNAAAATTLQAAATSQLGRQAPRATIATAVQQVSKQLPAQNRQQPGQLSQLPPMKQQQQQEQAASAVQDSSRQQGRFQQSSAAAPPQQQRDKQHQGAAVAAQPLGCIVAALAGVAIIVREVVDAAMATYTDTLKPAAGVLWQLAAAVGGLIGVLVMYLLLPLLKVVTVVLQRLLLAASKVLHGCNRRFGTLLTPCTAIAAAAGASISSSAASSSSIDVSAQHARPPSNQLQLLLSTAQQQLVAVLSSSPDLVLDFSRDVWMGSRNFERLLPPDAGYGPCAFTGSFSSTRVAVQVQELEGREQINVWCEAVRALKDLSHRHVLTFHGASVGTIPRVKVYPDTAAAAAAGGLEAPTPATSAAEVLVGCLVYQELEQARDFISAVKHPSAINHISRYNTASTANFLGITGGSSSAAAANAASTAPAEEQPQLTTWVQRLQLAAPLVSGLHYLCMQCTAQAALVHEAALSLQVPATTTVLLQGACVESVNAPASADMLSTLVKFYSWVGDITTQQLAAAAVVEAAAGGYDVKLNPSLLVLQQHFGRSQAADANTISMNNAASKRASQSTNAVLPAVGDLLLMLVTGGNNVIGANWLNPGVSRSALASKLFSMHSHGFNPAMLLPRGERLGDHPSLCADAAAAVLHLMTQQAAHLLAWELPTQIMHLQLQQWQQQREHQRLILQAVQGASYSAAAAAAEQLAEGTESSQHQQQQQAQQTTQLASAAAIAGTCAGSRFYFWRSRPPTASNITGRRSAGRHGDEQAAVSVIHVLKDMKRAAELAWVRAEAVMQYNWDDLLDSLQAIARACTAEEGSEDDDLESDLLTAVSDVTSTEDEDWQQPQQQHTAAAAAGHRTTTSPQDPPSYFICPVTLKVMDDPVFAADGYTYERSAIAHWLQVAGVRRSPMTNEPMEPVLVPNHSLRSTIMEWRSQQQMEWH